MEGGRTAAEGTYSLEYMVQCYQILNTYLLRVPCEPGSVSVVRAGLRQ